MIEISNKVQEMRLVLTCNEMDSIYNYFREYWDHWAKRCTTGKLGGDCAASLSAHYIIS